jgi:hypothetical protein
MYSELTREKLNIGKKIIRFKSAAVEIGKDENCRERHGMKFISLNVRSRFVDLATVDKSLQSLQI